MATISQRLQEHPIRITITKPHPAAKQVHTYTHSPPPHRKPTHAHTRPLFPNPTISLTTFHPFNQPAYTSPLNPKRAPHTPLNLAAQQQPPFSRSLSCMHIRLNRRTDSASPTHYVMLGMYVHYMYVCTQYICMVPLLGDGLR